MQTMQGEQAQVDKLFVEKPEKNVASSCKPRAPPPGKHCVSAPAVIVQQEEGCEHLEQCIIP